MSFTEHLTILKLATNKGNYSHNLTSGLQNNIIVNRSLCDKRSSPNQSTELYIISDIVALSLGFFGAWLFSLMAGNAIVESNDLFLSQVIDVRHIFSFLGIAVVVLLWFVHDGHYRVRMPFWSELQKIVKTLSFALLADGFLQFVMKQDISRLSIIFSWIIAAFAVIWLRAIVRKITLKHGSFQIPTLLIGSGEIAQQTLDAIESAPEMGYSIVAQIKNLPEAFLLAGSSWGNLCEQFGAKYLLIALDIKDFQGAENIIKKITYESIPYSISSPIQNFPVAGMELQYLINHNIMFFTRDNGVEQYLPRFIKRLMDITISGLALVLLSPVMLIIATLVKLDGGSAFFGHNRLGRGGRTFPCLKFRSMVMDGDAILKQYLDNNPEAAAEWKATQKLQNDPRVTRLGKILRKTSIDELPQLINVLRGEMSLVGPRPIVSDEVAHYNNDIKHYYRVRPGVTGLWQVSGRNDVSYGQRVQMDSWYVCNWSLWHDIVIMLKTFPAVFKRNGAY